MNYDIVIVGGGPAGLSAATYATRLGAKVAVLEKSKEIGCPIHTSGGSWIDELRKLNIPKKFMHPINKGDFIFGKTKITFEYKNSPACILDVRGLYQYLAEQASLSGAEIFVNAYAEGPIIENKFVKGVIAIINGNELKIASKLVIDASGFNSVIARKIGIISKFECFGNGAEYELVSSSWEQDRVAFIYGSRIAPAGYGWVFPCGNNRIRVGTGIIHPVTDKNPTKLLNDFLSSNDDLAQQLKPFSRIEYHRGLIPNVGVVSKTVANGLIVVGDAAGQVSGITGEGIRFAINIGRIAGRIAAEAINKNNITEKHLTKYEQLWRKKYERIFKISYEINKRLRYYTDKDWEKKVKYLDQIDSDIFVEFLKSNFSINLILKILAKQPSILSNGVFQIIKKMVK